MYYVSPRRFDCMDLTTQPATQEETTIHHKFLSKPSPPKQTPGVNYTINFDVW